MSRQILIIQGHPDPEPSHYGYALAEAYARGARQGGHRVDEIRLAELDIPFLRSEHEWRHAEPPADILRVREAIRRADHLVFVFPLWLGTMPALVKAFFEQTMRPGFAFSDEAREGRGERLLKGKSARVIITMGMPGPVYRWFYGAHGYRNLKRNVLKFTGIRPVRHSFVGMMGAAKPKRREKWLSRIEKLARTAT